MSQDEKHLIDPEPFSTLLFALSAAGSIASLLAYVGDRISTQRTERDINRFAIRDSITGVETSLNELRGYVRSLEILFITGSATRGGQSPPMLSIAEFGRVSLTFTRDGYERWREIEESIVISAGRIQRYMSDLMRHFATTTLRLPVDTAERLISTINTLNAIVRRLNQTHFEDLFKSLEEVVGESMDVMRQLRQDLDSLIR